jgi:hypothetical protein
MKKKSALAAGVFAIALLTLAFAGCVSDQNSDSGSAVDGETSEIGLVTSDMFSDRDLEIGYTDYITVNISNAGCTATSDQVTIAGSTVTLTAEGTYLIQGSLSDGQIIVDAGEEAKLQIVLADAAISNADSAALYIMSADKVFLTLAPDSENTLAVTGDYVQTDDNTVDAAIFAKSDLTLNGSGSLTINAAYGHGVVSKDDLAITGGSFEITAAEHGLVGKNSVRIASGTFDITSGEDGIHTENNDDTSLGYIYIADGNFVITAQSDGIDAKDILQIDDGDFDISCGEGSASVSTAREANPDGWSNWGGWDQVPQQSTDGSQQTQPQRPSDTDGANSDTQTLPDGATTPQEGTTTEAEDDTSIKGLKATTDLVIKGGSFKIDATDDAIHSNANIYLLGGEFNLASGDDGVHADSATIISDGNLMISECYEGIEGNSIEISGGTFDITADDDGLNAAGGADSSGTMGPGGDNFSADSNCYINISSGEIKIASLGDGIDSNGSITVSGGNITVFGPVSGGNSAIDYMGEGTISGGIVIALGSSGMAINFDDNSTQGSILCNLDSAQAAETVVTLIDSNGQEIISVTSPKQYQSVLISSPEIQSGETYTLTCGELSQTIEMTGTIYSNGAQGGGMGGNGNSRQQQMPGQATDDASATEE